MTRGRQTPELAALWIEKCLPPSEMTAVLQVISIDRIMKGAGDANSTYITSREGSEARGTGGRRDVRLAHRGSPSLVMAGNGFRQSLRLARSPCFEDKG